MHTPSELQIIKAEIMDLFEKGWTSSAIAEEFGLRREAVEELAKVEAAKEPPALDEETDRLVQACEDAWSWYVRALVKKGDAKTDLMRDFYEKDLSRWRKKHQAARAALAAHLAAGGYCANAQPVGDDDPSRA